MSPLVEGILLFVLGLSFTLFGMNMMSKGLERMSGGRLERVLEKATDTKSRFPIVGRIKGVFVGSGVTALVQSSSSTTVMTVGFVNAGIMRLEQTVGIIMGANIGTTITSWIFALTGIESSAWYVAIFKPSTFSPVLALIGIVLMLFFSKQKHKDLGSTLVSFGVLMYGMSLMSSTCSQLADNPIITEIFMSLENPILGVLAGAVFTGIIQASAAAIGIVQALTVTGSITYGAAIPIILGTNIGTCVTAMLSCVGASKNAKRTAMVHLFFNIVGTIFFLALFYLLDWIIGFDFLALPLQAADIAVVHTVFNVAATLLFLPTGNLLAKLAKLIIPDKPTDKDVHTTLLDPRFLKTPGFAIQQCITVAEKMAQLSRETLKRALDSLGNYDEKIAETILEDEAHLDRYEDKLGSYLVQISSSRLSEQDGRKVNQLLHVLSDFERIGDHSVNIMQLAKEMKQKNMTFSKEGAQEFSVLKCAVEEILDLAIEAYLNDDAAAALRVEPLEDVIDALVRKMNDHHIARLQEGVCTIEQGFVYHDLLTNLERVSDHCSNVAVDLIETKQQRFNTHGYILDIKTDEQYGCLVDEFSAKYSL